MTSVNRFGVMVVGLVCGCIPADPKDPRTVYRIERWTVNPTACDREGPAQTMSSDPRFAVNPEPGAAGTATAIAATCTYSNCLARTAATTTEAWTMDRVVVGSYARSVLVASAAAPCAGWLEARRLTQVGSGSTRTFRMEIRRQPFSLASAACTEAERRAAAEAAACNYLEVIVGPFDRDEDESGTTSTSSSFDDD